MPKLQMVTNPAPDTSRDERAKKIMRAIQAARRKHPSLADDEPWRDALDLLIGIRSLRAMTIKQLNAVLDHLNGKPAGSAAKGASDNPLARKVSRLWNVLELLGGIDADEAVTGLRGFVMRQAGVASAEWLAPDQASSVVEALRGRIERAGWKVPAGKAAIGDVAQRAYVTALHRRLQAIGGTTLNRDNWLAANVGVQAIAFSSTAQIKAAVDALESAIRLKSKGA